MRALLEDSALEEAVGVESAGTSAEHLGDEPDPRAHETAEQHGVTVAGTAQQFEIEDFDRFEYILAMDAENRDELSSLAPDEDSEEKIFLIRDFEANARRDQDVPDPYYGGDRGFENVYNVVLASAEGLLEHIEQHDL